MAKSKVKIYGAGSIGNHLAQASRRMGWGVSVVDIDREALRRMQNDIYPKRYGAWDENIKLYHASEEPKGGFDVIFIGTPPDARLELAKKALDQKPRVLQLEKPLAPPILQDLPDFYSKIKKSNIIACVGYDHVVAEGAEVFSDLIKKANFGEPETLDVEFRVYWQDIFNAHPWLAGPHDSYLGFWRRGGGASGEHSHAANLWQHFSRILGQGKVKEVSANLQYVKDDKVDYDKICLMHLTTETGFTGRVVQDVVTKPHRQWIRLQGQNGFVEWYIRWNADGDMVRWQEGNQEIQEKFIAKKRPDDFYREVLHINELLEGRVRPEDSPMSLERGLDTLGVIAAAHLSSEKKKSVHIDYDRGYGPDSLEIFD